MERAEGSPCACLPDWAKQYGKDGESQLCCYCHQSYDPGEGRGCVTLVSPCSRIPGRVHFTTVLFHEKCAHAWKDAYDTGIQAELSECMPHSLNVPRKTLEFGRDRCLAEHKPIMAFCAGCGVQAQERCRFRACSGCRTVRYCTEACQHAHWPQHKPMCKPATKGPIERRPINESERCSCFTPYETILFERSFTNLCSNAPCEKVVNGPVPLSMYTGECVRKDKPSRVPHIISTKYCSQKCQIACTSSK